MLAQANLSNLLDSLTRMSVPEHCSSTGSVLYIGIWRLYNYIISYKGILRFLTQSLSSDHFHHCHYPFPAAYSEACLMVKLIKREITIHMKRI